MKFVRSSDLRETLKIGAYVDPLYPLKRKMHKSLAKYISQVDVEEAAYDMDGWLVRENRTIYDLYETRAYDTARINGIPDRAVYIGMAAVSGVYEDELLGEIFPEFDQLEQDSVIMDSIRDLQDNVWEYLNECTFDEALQDFAEAGICSKEDPDYDDKFQEWFEEGGYEGENGSLGHTQYFYSAAVYKWWCNLSESTKRRRLREFAECQNV